MLRVHKASRESKATQAPLVQLVRKARKEFRATLVRQEQLAQLELMARLFEVVQARLLEASV